MVRRLLMAFGLVVAATLVSAAPAGAARLDHTGCAGGTCITVQSQGGHGLDVIQIKAFSAFSIPFACSNAILFVNNIVAVNEFAGCANGYIHFFVAPWVPRHYNNGTNICVTLTAMGGKACALIHS